MEPLKLVALDEEDLAILSAHLQDAVVRAGDLAYLAKEKRFALVARRFDWTAPEDEPRRRLSGLHFERVMRVRTRNIDLGRADEVLSLLAVHFTVAEAPSGTATLFFSGDAAVQLELECIEAGLSDLGPAWSADTRPSHDATAA
jgi:hypothetical protein